MQEGEGHMAITPGLCPQAADHRGERKTTYPHVRRRWRPPAICLSITSLRVRGIIAKGHKVSFRGDENVLNMGTVKAAYNL